MAQLVFLPFLLSTLTSGTSFAQSVRQPFLPVPGAMVLPSPAFEPSMLKGVTLHPEHPLKFDFIVSQGKERLPSEALRQESLKLVKYFLASLTVPESELWVNLSPYEKDRIIPEAFGMTEMGRDVLAQDYLLKQLMASLMYPEEEVGRAFWTRVYSQAQARYGTTDIPLETFHKIWILPDKAMVYERGNSAYVVQSRLKVMLEEDYINDKWSVISDKSKPVVTTSQPTTYPLAFTTQIIKEILLPEIEREVNEGRTFANLRQIFNAMILAAWYKQVIKEGLLSRVYVNQSKLKGVDVEDKTIKKKIYAQYLEAMRIGVYNYIREDINPLTREIIPRKYFSGGANFAQFLNTASVVFTRLPPGAITLVPQGDHLQILRGDVQYLPKGEASWIQDSAGEAGQMKVAIALTELPPGADPVQVAGMLQKVATVSDGAVGPAEAEKQITLEQVDELMFMEILQVVLVSAYGMYSQMPLWGQIAVPIGILNSGFLFVLKKLARTREQAWLESGEGAFIDIQTAGIAQDPDELQNIMTKYHRDRLKLEGKIEAVERQAGSMLTFGPRDITLEKARRVLFYLNIVSMMAELEHYAIMNKAEVDADRGIGYTTPRVWQGRLTTLEAEAITEGKEGLLALALSKFQEELSQQKVRVEGMEQALGQLEGQIPWLARFLAKNILEAKEKFKRNVEYFKKHEGQKEENIFSTFNTRMRQRMSDKLDEADEEFHRRLDHLGVLIKLNNNYTVPLLNESLKVQIEEINEQIDLELEEQIKKARGNAGDDRAVLAALGKTGRAMVLSGLLTVAMPFMPAHFITPAAAAAQTPILLASTQSSSALEAELAKKERELAVVDAIIARYGQASAKIGTETNIKIKDRLLGLEQILRVPLISDTLVLEGSIRGGWFGDRIYGNEPTLSYSTMYPSPFGTIELGVEFDTSFLTGKVGAAYGLAEVNSRPFFAPGTLPLTLESIFRSRDAKRFQQTWKVKSFYADLGHVFRLEENLAFALFGGVDSWEIQSGDPGNYNYRRIQEANAGGHLLFYPSEHSRLSLSADVNFEMGDKTFYQVPGEERIFTESVGLKLGYARLMSNGYLLNAGLGGTWRQPYSEIEASFGLGTGRFDLSAQLGYRISQHPFFDDGLKLGGRFTFHAIRGLDIGLMGFWHRRHYSVSEVTHKEAEARLFFEWRQPLSSRYRGRVIVEKSVLQDFYKNSYDLTAADQVARKFGGNDFNLYGLVLDPRYREAVRSSQPLSGDLAFWLPFVDRLNQAMRSSGNYQDFVNKLDARSAEEILAVLAVFSRVANDYNYNTEFYKKGHHNLQSQEALYKAITGSIIIEQDGIGRKNPVLISGTMAQMIAEMAEDLGRKAGINIHAMATGPLVPGDKRGSFSGHGVTVLLVPGYGLVIGEWGKFTPTFTYDFVEALRIYQAIEGIPGLISAITDPQKGGRHLGYVLSEEGKLTVEALTILGTQERGNLITLNRFLAAADAKLQGSKFLAINAKEPPSLELVRAQVERWLILKDIESIKEQLRQTKVKDGSMFTAQQKRQASRENRVGGINLDPGLLDLQIKRDASGVPLPLAEQPFHEMQIDGFIPVILEMVPVNVPALLGFSTPTLSPGRQMAALTK